jgi:transposase
MATPVVERMDHLGIVAGVCDEIGLVEYFDALDTQWHARVSLGQAVKAMVLNGLGFSNRRLYLFPQFFANKPVEALLGPGITPEDLNDDCLDRALDWLFAHDVTALFAGLAAQARQRWGFPVQQLHVDTTSFAVEGEYQAAEGDLDARVIAVTYGYSRDRRADLKQWMCALATTNDSDIPVFLRPLDGNSSDKDTLLQAVLTLQQQIRDALAAERELDPLTFVADSGLYSERNMRQLAEAGVRWISRVPETGAQAQEVIGRTEVVWQEAAGTDWSWWATLVPMAHGSERWLVVRSTQGLARAQTAMERKAQQDVGQWEKALWHLSTRTFACAADAQAALTQALRSCPPWLRVTTQVVPQPQYRRPGRPRTGTTPTGYQYAITATVMLDVQAVTREAERRAAFIVATNILDPTDMDDIAVIQAYKQQGSVERGFAFLKDPLFLASSVFVKKPERIMALAFVMVVCLLVYRLAEQRVRLQLSATGQTLPDQLKHPTQRPTMRWIFQCFEGLDVLKLPDQPPLLLRIEAFHQQVLALLGDRFRKIYYLTE